MDTGSRWVRQRTGHVRPLLDTDGKYKNPLDWIWVSISICIKTYLGLIVVVKKYTLILNMVVMFSIKV